MIANQFYLLWCKFKWPLQQVQWRGESKKKPKKGIALHVVATDGCSLLILADWFFYSVCSASVLVTTGRVRRCLQPYQVAQVVLASPGWHTHLVRSQEDSLFLPAQDKAGEGHQTSSRSGICSFVRGGTGEALPEPCKMTSNRLLACMFLTKLSETDSMSHDPAARLAFARKHRNRSPHRWEQVHTKHTGVKEYRDTITNIMLPVTSSSMTGLAVGQFGLGRLILGGSQSSMSDRCYVPGRNPYAGVVSPGFLLVQDNVRPNVARVCRQFLDDEGIDAIDWPSRSLDLNWAPIGRFVLVHPMSPSSTRDCSGAH